MESSKPPALLLFLILVSSTAPVFGCGSCEKPHKPKPTTPTGPSPVLPVPKLPLPPLLPIPKLPVPPVTVPKLPVPPVTVPKLPVPPVTVPKLPVPPALPSLPLPPALPSLPIPPVLPSLPLPPVLPVPPVLPKPTPSGKPCPPGGGGSSPTPSAPKCPIDILKLGACVDLLGGLVHVGLGDPVVNHCCPILKGLVELEAAACLCTTLKLKALNLKLYVPVALQLLVTCGKNPPPGFTCSL